MTFIDWVQITGHYFWDKLYNINISGDGTTIIHGANVGAGNVHYRSYDFGSTWLTNSIGMYAITGYYLSYDGSKIIHGWGYAGSQGSIVLYEGSSVSSIFGSDHIWALGLSGDGNYMLAGLRNTDIYLSSDGGLNWNLIRTASSNSFTTGAMNYDGQYMVYSVDGRLYRTANYGGNWAEIKPIGETTKTWRSAHINQEGSKWIISSSERIYISSNYGINWTEIRPIGDINKNWRVDFSDNANIIIAGVNDGGRLYISKNGGSTWSEERPSGDVDGKWRVSMSDDGTRYAVNNTNILRGYLGTASVRTLHLLPVMGAG